MDIAGIERHGSRGILPAGSIKMIHDSFLCPLKGKGGDSCPHNATKLFLNSEPVIINYCVRLFDIVSALVRSVRPTFYIPTLSLPHKTFSALCLKTMDFNRNFFTFVNIFVTYFTFSMYHCLYVGLYFCRCFMDSLTLLITNFFYSRISGTIQI